MSDKSIWKQLYEGIWPNNVVLQQTLALCPTLAVTGSATNGLGMGLATLVVITLSNLVISLIRHWVTPQVRIPVFTLIIAALVTIVDQAMNAYVHDLHKILGLFIPLIVTNCAIFGRAESFAAKNKPVPSLIDGIATGLGFTLALVLLGGMREIVGQGTLFSHASLLLGPHFTWLEITVLPHYRGFIPALLPSGGFIFLGLLLVAKRLIERISIRKTIRSTSPMESNL
ncbi:MAG: Ion-translocating oxidoreductase complex subunit E [Candidatus Celerinatantimonas neptuna]|nr:MAG: Ion-translocating oxidoreductase complex subunit E [Candidatus Celerinatantimonas neptuna]